MPEPKQTTEEVVTTQQTGDQGLESLGGKQFSMKDFLDKAPIVRTGGVDVKQEETEEDKTNQADDEFEVKANVQPAEAKKDGESTDLKPGEEVQSSKPGMIKIGDLEMTQEEWMEAHGDRKNRQNWRKNLTQRSQVASTATDEQIQLLIPYAYKQREIPENLSEIALKDSKLPKSFTFTDDEGDEITVPISALPKELLSVLADNAFNAKYPDLEKMRTELEDKSGKVDAKYKEIQAYQMHDANQKAISFMKEHPEYAISVRKGENVLNNLKDILSTQGDHPETANAERLLFLVNRVAKVGGTLEEAYAFYNADKIKSEKAKADIKRKQAEDIGTVRDGEKVIKTPEQQFIDAHRDPRQAEFDKVFH